MSEPTALPFRPLGKYNWPSTPVDHGFDRFKSAFMKRFTGSGEKSAIDRETLEPATDALKDMIAPPPANRPLMAELDATLSDWLATPETDQPLRMIVLPPCDREDTLSAWATENGLELFSSDRDPSELDELDNPDAPPIIIPRLEDRFLRTPQGLVAVRGLIDRLPYFKRRALIGCNSWAWQFLRKSCEIDLVLSDPLTFHAYNRVRLRNWLGSLALGNLPEDRSETAVESLCCRAVDNGEDVFGNGDGEDEMSAYMTELARRSFGIPWVAWHLWRGSLRQRSETAPDAKNGDATDSDKGPDADKDKGKSESGPDTIWVDSLPSYSMPARSDQNALLVLHALLIHGGLSAANIERTVPLISYTNVLSSLLRAGLIDDTDGLFRCVPAAYPTIRDGLRNNGYPLDVL